MTNPLTDVLPRKARKIIYAIAFVALLIWTAFQGAEGDWSKVIGGVLTSLVPLLAASNTPPPLEDIVKGDA